MTYTPTNDVYTYPRDTVLSTVAWDSPACVNASQECTGASWAPHYRVQFNAAHTASRVTNSPTWCNTGTNMRCDDPGDWSGNLAAPLVNSTFVLNDAAVQTNLDGSAWHTVRDYQMSYAENGSIGVTDPVTGLQESVAGYLDLTKLQEIGDDGATPSPAQSFTYTNVTEYYEDGNFTPYSTSFCGPSWNTGGNGGTCDLWSQSYDGNSHYLASISNGQGLSENITWADARNNTHGVNSGLGTDIANPLYCNNLSAAGQASYPCSETDDQQWSHVVVTDRSDSVVQLTQQGQGGSQTSLPVVSHTAYFYRNTYPLVAQACTDCVSGMYWGDQNDDDYLDYYNATYMGFSMAIVA